MTRGFRLNAALLLVGLARLEATSEAQEPEASASLHVELCDTTGLGDSILHAARGEASEIFSRVEIHVQWEGGCDVVPRTTPQSARIYVVPHVPEGIAKLLYKQRRITGVMGYFALVDVEKGVHASAGRNRAAVIYVARQAVEEVASKSGRNSLTDAIVARAMGRVFAHELAHRFLGQAHTRNGILKDRLYQKDLIDLRNGGLFFSPEQIRLLRLRIAQGGYAAER